VGTKDAVIAVELIFLFNTSICADSGATDLIEIGFYLKISAVHESPHLTDIKEQEDTGSSKNKWSFSPLSHTSITVISHCLTIWKNRVTIFQPIFLTMLEVFDRCCDAYNFTRCKFFPKSSIA